MGQVQFPTQLPCVIVGGVVFTDLDNLVELVSYADGTAGARYSTMRLPSASAGYQVPASKSFYLRATRIGVVSGAGANKMAFPGYGDTDVGLTSAAAPTNVTWPGASSDASFIVPPSISATTQNPYIENPFFFTVPTAKYPCVLVSSGLLIAAHYFGYTK